MDDRDVEDLLSAYRPAGPSAELRGRILGSVRLQPDRDVRGLRWQLVTAAALVLAAMLLHTATDNVDRRIVVNATAAPTADQQALDALTSELGGNVSARLMAEAMQRRDRDAAPAADQGISQ